MKTQEEQSAAATQKQRPEAVSLLGGVWVVLLSLEALHVILGVVMSLLDTAGLKAAVAKQMESMPEAGELSDSMMHAVMIAAVVLSAIVSLILVGILAWVVSIVWRPGKWSVGSRRLLIFFGIYYAIRAFSIFSLRPGSTSVPVGFFAVDGSIQVVVGVLAVMGLMFLFKEETLRWTGELTRRTPPDAPNKGQRP